MAGSSGEWDRYARWNAAVADIVYPATRAGHPVYLDLEDDVLVAIQARAEPGGGDPKAALIEAVKGTLPFGAGPSALLRGHLWRVSRWCRGEMLEPPPCLGLLALLSLAAESMRRTDGMRAYNFYGRLAENLRLTDTEKMWFESAYRSRDGAGVPASERLWSSVRDWLEALEGSRGLPTAQAIGHDHIGLPLSQALVRQVDRETFSDLFASHGLIPGASLPASEMQVHLDEWIARVPCPATNTLEQLWKQRPDAREPIAEVASLTLESWDGLAPEGSVGQAAQREVDAVRVKVTMRNFPSRRIELSMAIAGQLRDGFETAKLLGDDDDVVGAVDLVPLASGWIGVPVGTAIEAKSLLEDSVKLSRVDGAILRRRPRRLVPLRPDVLLNAFVECERVQLGEDSMILAASTVTPQVAAYLDAVARPGYRKHTDLPGLPEGWTLFQDVQVLTTSLEHQLVDLQTLRPIARSQVVVEGGLRLPGYLRKWLTSRPPEVRVTVEPGSSVGAHLTCVRPMANPVPADQSHEGVGSVLIWDLEDLMLPDGDYEICIETDGKKSRPELIRLRSADHPARQVLEHDDPIVHDPSDDSFGLFATRSSAEGAFAGVSEGVPALDNSEAPGVPRWWSARREAPTRSPAPIIRFPMGGHSCIRTGAHFIDLPMGLGGQQSIEGICRYCGLTKRYPTKYRRARQSARKHGLPDVLRVQDLAPVRTDECIDWQAAFDALCHTSSGSMGALERITGQLEATDLFGDAFARRLEVLGHIEIQRDRATLRNISWQVVDPVLLGLPSGEVVMTGFRSDRSMVALEDVAWALKVDLDIDDQVDAPPKVTVRGADDAGLQKLAGAVTAATDRTTRIVLDAALKLASRLPPLSRARKSLPSTSLLAARAFEAWDPVTARFRQAVDAGAAGAFRLTSTQRSYIYRQSDDLGLLRATLGDARIVKYLAAADSGISLVGYDADAQVLYVPLGADLPGLYGRAAVLASGGPARENRDDALLEYRKVPAALAAHIARLLMS